MSVIILRDDVYEDWYWRELKRNIDKGMFLDDARAEARRVMSQCAQRASDLIQCDNDKDYSIHHRDLVDDWWSPQ